MPDVSVVLPCFNAHAFLDRALDSVRAQTITDLEILIVDDGSTDPDTIAYLDALDPAIRLVRQENRGLAGARNRAFEEARGRFVLPLDCDDWIAPDFIAKALDAVGDSDNVFAFAWLDVFGDFSAVLQKNWNLYEQLFFNQLPYCMLIPKALWARVGGYDETMRWGYEDWDFNIRLGLAGAEGRVIAEPLFHYYASGGGMLQTLSNRRYAELWAGIQAKHRDTYRLGSLLTMKKAWAGRPSTYPPTLLLLWWLAFRALPRPLFQALFDRLLRHSHVRRTAAA